jgi:hypothetical protein
LDVEEALTLDDLPRSSAESAGCGTPGCTDPNCDYGKGPLRCQSCGAVVVGEPQTAWTPGEREAVARALFGDGWESCANLGPYVLGVVNELNEARELIGTFNEDTVEHQRDLLQQTSQLSRHGRG